jgi:ABC-2 type transport system ATP-binding protein
MQIGATHTGIHSDMIEIDKLTKRYGQHVAVDHISFKAKAGEIVGLLGPNGAGKTSTMRMLTTFMPPSDGTAKVAGFDIQQDSFEVRKRVGYLPERIPIYPDMTVWGYVAFWARLRGVKNLKQVDAILDRVQLLDRRKTLLRNLSKGMRQRLGLAQALVHDPPVVILDEPTIGIDPQQVIEVRDAVRQLGEKHTVLFSTHILSEAEQVCDRVVIINRGKIVAQGTSATLRAQLQPGTHLFVQVGGTSAEAALKLLRAIPGVTDAQASGAGYSVRSGPKHDVRAEISGRIASAGYALLEMRPVALTLEDIFLDIVGREGQS